MTSFESKLVTPSLPLIRATELSRVHQKGSRVVNALRPASFDIHAGEYLAITGPSGSGKSTLLSLLGLLDRPTSGSYHLEGMDVAAVNDKAKSLYRNKLIGFVFQSFHLVPHLTAWRNVALPLQYSPQRVSRTEMRQRALATLESVGMFEQANHLPRELSGGQEQRVAIARALVNRPRLILADEPTGNLDSNSRDDVLILLEQAYRRGATVVIVTHDQEIAKRANRRIQMSDGQLAFSS